MVEYVRAEDFDALLNEYAEMSERYYREYHRAYHRKKPREKPPVVRLREIPRPLDIDSTETPS